MMRLECYRIHDDVTLPKVATQGSACFDVHAYIKPTIPITVYGMDNKKEEVLPLDGRIALRPGDRVLVPTGIIFRIPFGVSMRLHARSSVSLKRGLIMPNGEGIIDYKNVNENVYFHFLLIQLICHHPLSTIHLQYLQFAKVCIFVSQILKNPSFLDGYRGYVDR